MSKTNQPVKINTIKIDISTRKQLKESFREESQTIVHCRYVSKRKYINGGWVNIFPTTYLVNGDEKLELLYADNIPMAPEYHFFNHPGEIKEFTLFFPAIPKDWKMFKMVEECFSEKGFIVNNIHRNDDGIYHLSLV